MIDLRRWEGHGAVVRVAELAIGIVFLIAALAQVGDLQTFAGQVHNFRLVPIALENAVAMTLPWIELVCGLALVMGVRPRAGAVVAAVLMLVFTVAVAAALARGLNIECGCFGKADASRVGGLKLAQNLGLVALSAVATLRRKVV
jgi:uncharacterized membrane protein YphA (DoxX/SURF4 family)